MNMKQFLYKNLKELNFKIHEDKKVDSLDVGTIIFSSNREDTDLQFALIFSKLDDSIYLNVFATFPQPFLQPSNELYQVLNKLNLNSDTGFLVFTQENEQYFISYRSTLLLGYDQLENDLLVQDFIFNSVNSFFVKKVELSL
ncbi:MAG: hypothetical protein CNE98_01460 [Bacteroidetes bacterium MED-G17]|nr:MAG: hypothetical protein CBB99_01665 [Bacteroidetes bacterium TMED39]PDH53267.1 MAG: hypothetical protein CNE98_01460 [Bacteroidetes bacterium MED-G17]CAI8289313.1 MAG: Uncharacterised protein [Bacteroidetes bacterium MED-G17]